VVTVWDLAGGGAPTVLRGHGGGVSGVAVCPSGERVAAASDDGVGRLWNRADPRRPVVLPLGGGAALAVAFGADGTRLTAGSIDGEVRVWRGNGHGHPRILRGHRGPV
jgi:WD40 repeat protein